MGTRANKADQAREFFKKIADEGAFKPVFLVQGEERFLVDQAVAKITKAVFPDGRDDFNYISYHGNEAKGTDIASAASQAPMFAAKRLVIVRNADRLAASEMEPLAAYAADPATSTVLVIEAVKLDGRSKAVKALSKAKSVQKITFKPLYAREAAAWVNSQAPRFNLQFRADVGGYLVDAVGTSLAQLDMALERIALYLGDENQVTLDAVRAIVPDTRSRSVFELTDHLALRRLDAAIGCFHRMIYQGDSPIGALAMVARQFRQLLMAHDGAALGLSSGEMASHIGCPPFKVRDYIKASRNFTEPRLRELLRLIAETDLALKSSRVKRELIIERLFVRICAAEL